MSGTAPQTDHPLLLRWDDSSIQREATVLPENLREDYIYLKSFARDQCAKDLDLLAQRMLQLGLDTDRTTWAKILRGRMTIDTHGRDRPHPVMSFEKFSEVVTALRNNVRVESLQGRVGWIETSQTKRQFDYYRLKWNRSTVNKFGIISGPTGSGKSAAGNEFQRQNNHGLCVKVEAPEGGGLMELVTQIGIRYGIGAKRNYGSKKTAIFSTVTARNMIIIDNAQELWVAGGGADQPKFSFLRRLQDETGCTIILLITPMFERTVRDQMLQGYFEQFIGRTGGIKNWLRLADYPPEEDCLAIANAMGLKDAASHAKKLTAIAREPGRIRQLFEDLQQGKRLATAAKSPFTFAFVEEAREDV